MVPLHFNTWREICTTEREEGGREGEGEREGERESKKKDLDTISMKNGGKAYLSDL